MAGELRQRDIAATMRHVLAVRGDGWAARTIRKAVDSPYGRACGLDGLDGFDGLTRFWSDYQVLADRLFDEGRLAKLSVEVAVGGWTDVLAPLAPLAAHLIQLGQRNAAEPMDALTILGACAVTAMLVFYALEARSPRFVLAFAGACLASSAYGFLQGAWPFGVVELIWAVVALRRWWTRRVVPT